MQSTNDTALIVVHYLKASRYPPAYSAVGWYIPSLQQTRASQAAITGAHLSGLLIVERSVTLSHLLKRALAAAGLSARNEVTGYLDAIEYLQHSVTLTQPYGVVIIGAPARVTREFSALLEFLCQGAMVSLPVLLLAHEIVPELTEWCAARVNASTVLWAQFSRIPGMVAQLSPIESQETPAISLNVRPVSFRTIRVLLVDDSQSVRAIYGQLLEQDGFAVEVTDSLKQARAHLAQQHFDLAIIDYFLPDGTGDELCRYLSGLTEKPVLAIITSMYREDVVKRCLEAGAVEFCFKNETKELFSTRVRILAQQIQMQKTAESERQRLDGVLGTVDDGVYGVDSNGVITFINPTGVRLLGYADEADLVGQSAYALLHHITDNGAVLTSEASVLGRSYVKGEALKAHKCEFWQKSGRAMEVECTVLPLVIHTRHEGSIVVFRGTRERQNAQRPAVVGTEAVSLVDRLRVALEQERFVLLTRPILPMASLPESPRDQMLEHPGWRMGEMAQSPYEHLFEVLVRLVGKDGRLIPPSVFVPLAERTGMMAKIDLWVISRLLRHMPVAKDKIAFNVNLSNTTLTDSEAVAAIETMLGQAGIPAQQLVVQMAETKELTNPHVARRFMSVLKKQGCRFALNNFGTGFSSFTHLRHLPVDFIKVEGSFIEGMTQNARDHAMVSAIIQLARSLQLKVIGKHVDNLITLNALRDCGAEYAQGNYVGEPRPLRAVNFAALFPKA